MAPVRIGTRRRFEKSGDIDQPSKLPHQIPVYVSRVIVL
jgi:hypothetical protein